MLEKQRQGAEQGRGVLAEGAAQVEAWPDCCIKLFSNCLGNSVEGAAFSVLTEKLVMRFYPWYEKKSQKEIIWLPVNGVFSA